MEELSNYRTTANQIPQPIDRLFLKLATGYGKLWIDFWAGIPMDAVKQEWQSKLAGMSSKVVMTAADYCIEKVDYVPTLNKFLAVCKARTPAELQKALPRHYTDAEMDLNRERISKISDEFTKRNATDYLAWAKNADANASIFPVETVTAAREVLLKFGIATHAQAV